MMQKRKQRRKKMANKSGRSIAKQLVAKMRKHNEETQNCILGLHEIVGDDYPHVSALLSVAGNTVLIFEDAVLKELDKIF